MVLLLSQPVEVIVEQGGKPEGDTVFWFEGEIEGGMKAIWAGFFEEKFPNKRIVTPTKIPTIITIHLFKSWLFLRDGIS